MGIDGLEFKTLKIRKKKSSDFITNWFVGSYPTTIESIPSAEIGIPSVV
jgi:hypothetical protein